MLAPLFVDLIFRLLLVVFRFAKVCFSLVKRSIRFVYKKI